MIAIFRAERLQRQRGFGFIEARLKWRRGGIETGLRLRGRGGVEMANIFENVIAVFDDGLLEERSVKGLNFEPDFHGDYKFYSLPYNYPLITTLMLF